MRQTKRDVAQEITNLIIKTMRPERCPGAGPGKTGMGEHRCAAGVPTGINRLYLWAVADHYGYGSRYWMTWRQAIGLGGQVRKGETAEPSIYFNSTKTAIDHATGEDRRKPSASCAPTAYSTPRRSMAFRPISIRSGAEAPPTPSEAAAIERFFAPSRRTYASAETARSRRALIIFSFRTPMSSTEDGFVATKRTNSAIGRAMPRGSPRIWQRFGDKAYSFELVPYLDSLHRACRFIERYDPGTTQGVIRPDEALSISWRSPA